MGGAFSGVKLASVMFVVLCATARADAPTAAALFHDGQAAYDLGDFATAIARWQESYRLSGEPALLFNIGQAQRLSGHCREAVYVYRRYLALAPATAQRTLAEGYVRELATCDAPPPAERPQPAPVAPPPPAAANTARIERIAGIATSGAGAVLLVTGLLVGSHAGSLGDQVNEACTPASPCDWSVYGPIDASGRHDATVGHVLDGFGVAALAGGAALYYLGSRSPEVAVTPMVGSHDAGAVLTWRHEW